MPNITLTDSCNLSCKYCFASKFVNKKINEISIENFNKALAFIKTDRNIKSVGLIGGEPLLHSKFEEIALSLINDSDIFDIFLYTNGIMLGKYVELLSNKKFKILLNYNLTKDIGTEKIRKIENGLDCFINKKILDSVCVGFNIYETNVDYNEIISFLKKYNFKSLRVSIVVPNGEITSNEVEGYFKKYYNSALDLIELCIKNGITPYFDCNKIPYCILDERYESLKLMKKSGITLHNDCFNYKCNCNPTIDILPDLNAVRCFGLYDETKISINKFNSISDLYNYFTNKIDCYACKISVFEKCKDCYFRMTKKCTAGCLKFKLKQIKTLEKMIEGI